MNVSNHKQGLEWREQHDGDYIPTEESMELIPGYWDVVQLRGASPIPKVDGEVWLISEYGLNDLPASILDQLEQAFSFRMYYLRTFRRVMKDVDSNWLKKNFPGLLNQPKYSDLLSEDYFTHRLERSFHNLSDFGFYSGFMLLRYDARDRKWYGAKLYTTSFESLLDSAYSCAARLPERKDFRRKIAVGASQPRHRGAQQGVFPDKHGSQLLEFGQYEEQLEEAIRFLLMHDYPLALIEAMIDRHLRQSPIEVDWQYRIYLPAFKREDWEGFIELDPLPKTILLFFLRHADKRFQHYQLKEYEDEFLSIYNRFTNTGSDREETIRNRIHKLVTVNKYFSMLVNDIKQAFLEHLDDRVAQVYYVKKKRSGYGIELSPDLIQCP